MHFPHGLHVQEAHLCIPPNCKQYTLIAHLAHAVNDNRSESTLILIMHFNAQDDNVDFLLEDLPVCVTFLLCLFLTVAPTMFFAFHMNVRKLNLLSDFTHAISIPLADSSDFIVLE